MSFKYAADNCLVTFGVLTDIQYADCDNRPAAYDPSKLRFYRGALTHIDKAFTYWKQANRNVKFVLQLGDIIDGLNHVLGGSHSAMRETLFHFENHSTIPTFHTVGNHELYNFNRKQLAQLFYESVAQFNIPPEVFCPLKPISNPSVFETPTLYYKFCPAPNLKFISLDCFDISVLGYDTNHQNYKEAAKILESMHGHNVFKDWDCDGPLEGLDVRFQQMNGAIGKNQLTWLEKELTESDELGQKVIVFGHVSLSPDSTDWSCLLWNYDEVINIFHQHSCVVTYFSGHSHSNGYAIDSHGISYIVFTGIIETPPDSSAFATISIYADRLEISGHGREESYIIPFKRKSSDEPVDGEMEVSSVSYPVKVQV